MNAILCKKCNELIAIMIVIIIITRLAPFQHVAPLAANNLQSGLSNSSSVASCTPRL